MSISLEKVDQVIERTGVSYKAAKKALKKRDGNVLNAIIYLEEESKSKKVEEDGDFKQFSQFSQFGEDISNFFKDIIHKGNVNRITIEKDGKRILDLPVIAGAVGAVLFTPAIIVSLVAAFATGCEMSIHKEDGEVINVKDVTRDTLETVKQKIDEVSRADISEKKAEQPTAEKTTEQTAEKPKNGDWQ